MTEEDVLNLPLDRLALAVLLDWQETGQWNLSNYVNYVEQIFPRRQDVVRALIEAQNWLIARGLLARREAFKSSDEAGFITRLGEHVLAEGTGRVRASERLEVDLHPRLEKVRSQFLLGEYELAAFAAMREVEIRVRELADAEPSLIGVKLMHTALKVEGPLANPLLDPGEQQGLMSLFAGAIAVFKNPPSHRQVDYQEPSEASEVVLLANLLLRLLER